MSQFKYLIISTIILFLLVNLNYYLGGLSIILLLGGALFFLILTGYLIYQLFCTIREQFKNKPRIYIILIMSFLLGLIFFKPFGIVDFERFEGEDLLVAWQEGTANCSTTLKLKENKRVIITGFCFGENKILGTYSVEGDTIKFKFPNFNQRFVYGIYKRDKNEKYKGEILLYRSKKDSLPYPLMVLENDLIK